MQENKVLAELIFIFNRGRSCGIKEEYHSFSLPSFTETQVWRGTTVINKKPVLYTQK